MTGKKHTRLILSVMGVFLAVSLLFSACGSKKAYDESQYGLHLAEPDVVSENGPDMPDQDEILSQLNQQADAGMMSMTINADPNFLDGDNEGDLFIHCQETNKYPLVVQIIREDTDEAIYTSGTLQPGEEIKYDKLDVSLSAGDYPCVAYFYGVDPTGEISSTGAARLTIHVQS